MDVIDKIKAGMLDKAELLELVTSNDLAVALAVARSERATPPILDIAAHDNDSAVRLAAASNKMTGRETLLFLCHDTDSKVAEAASQEIERRERDGLVLQ